MVPAYTVRVCSKGYLVQLQGYESVGISFFEVYKRVSKWVILVSKSTGKG